MKEVERVRVALCGVAMLATIATAADATTTTPTDSAMRTPTCAPTGTPYCADHCSPCPTVRAGCFTHICGSCRENPVCADGEVCHPYVDLGACCSCATVTPAPQFSPTPTPELAGSPTSPVEHCEGDCDGDGAITIDELVAAVNEALGRPPAEGCESFDTDHDGAVGIHELIALVVTALAGCSDFDLSGVEGVYDVSGTRTDEFGGTGLNGLGIVQREAGRLLFEIEFAIGEFVRLNSERPGTPLRLEGGGATNGDLAFESHGTAAVTRTAQSIRIDLDVDATQSIRDDARLRLALERPTDGTPITYSGTHVLALRHNSHTGLPNESQIELSIDVPASGRASCGATRDVRDGDMVLAELPAAACAVSPLGRFSYYTAYDNGEQFPPPLKLFGMIAVDNSTQGIGGFSVGLHPVQRDTGSWRSQKIE